MPLLSRVGLTPIRVTTYRHGGIGGFNLGGVSAQFNNGRRCCLNPLADRRRNRIGRRLLFFMSRFAIVAEHPQIIVGHGLLCQPPVNVTRGYFPRNRHPEMAQVSGLCQVQGIHLPEVPATFTDNAARWEYPIAVVILDFA